MCARAPVVCRPPFCVLRPAHWLAGRPSLASLASPFSLPVARHTDLKNTHSLTHSPTDRIASRRGARQQTHSHTAAHAPAGSASRRLFLAVSSSPSLPRIPHFSLVDIAIDRVAAVLPRQTGSRGCGSQASAARELSTLYFGKGWTDRAGATRAFVCFISHALVTFFPTLLHTLSPHQRIHEEHALRSPSSGSGARYLHISACASLPAPAFSHRPKHRSFLLLLLLLLL